MPRKACSSSSSFGIGIPIFITPSCLTSPTFLHALSLLSFQDKTLMDPSSISRALGAAGCTKKP
ncbi:hypothetical protein ARMGADRAFT_1079207 [Armillaria gallica]|uniref:Uncharacterized protein n=1 Tax=Armillaria gallica TaxID=47427 RepID=A0A2H3E1U5_ARMGA|nr:hypothetical protein ARMGADRAFT_1079207 [Armillaria gallica]